jgi:hypothetical protein
MLWDEFLGAVLELAERGPSPPAIVSFPAKASSRKLSEAQVLGIIVLPPR